MLTIRGLAPSVKLRTPQNDTSLGKFNAYQHIQIFHTLMMIYSLLWLIVLSGAYHGWLGVVAAFAMFPLTICLVPLSFFYGRYAQAKLLTRVLDPASKVWASTAFAFTRSGSTLLGIFAAMLFPIVMPFLWIQDAVRFVKFVIANLKGEDVQWASDEAIFYKRQAQAYKEMIEKEGKEKADQFLIYSTCMTEVPNRTIISKKDWSQEVGPELTQWKAKKFGDFASYAS